MPRSPLRPRSVSGLLLAGFAVVTLPLMLAVGFAVVYVERLSDQSERLVEQGVQLTRLSAQLTDFVLAMERNAKQYAVLEEAKLSERFAEHHSQFQATVAALDSLHMDTMSDWGLRQLHNEVQIVATSVTASPDEARRLLEAQPETFAHLRRRTEAITAQGHQVIDRELARLQTTSSEAHLFLLLCVFAVLPMAALMVVLFTVVISRPIRQIRLAVRRLGEGDFSRPVNISAPSAELDALSGQLDWMRRRLAALESEKNQFLRHMSHELKTPLASIREGVELLRDKSLGELTEQQAEVMDILQRSSLELLSLIENLLNFAAWRQHRTQVTRKRFDLRDLVEEVLQRHRLGVEAKKLRIRRPTTQFILNADYDQMRLVLDNLVANAVKFSPQQGRLYIDAYRSRRSCAVEVADDGPGIPEADREHVFNPFYQSTQPEQSHVKGTGIGLSVVREAVRAHGGEVRVVDGPGRGACFQVILPVHAQ